MGRSRHLQRATRRLAIGAAAALVLAGLALLPAPAAGAAPATLTSVTAVRGGGHVGHGHTWTILGDSDVQLSGGPADVVVDADGERRGEELGDFRLRFVAPPGEVLRPGTYTAVRDARGEPVPGRAGMNVSGNGRGCESELRGRFTVLDVAYTGDRIDRLHLLYEQRCYFGEPDLFGEVRFQVPAHAGVRTTPSRVAWPATYPAVGAPPVPVTLANLGSGPVDLAAPRVDDDPSASFEVVSTTCPSRLAAGQSCVLHVRFTPSSAGPHAAVLVVPDGSATGGARVPLSGEGHPGTTAWRMHVQDESERSTSYDWTAVSGSVRASGAADHVRLEGSPGSGGFLAVDLGAGRGQPLEAGRTYEDVADYEEDGARPGLTIWQSGIACVGGDNRFTVHEVAFGPDGLERLSLTFEQQCAQVVSGSVAYRAEDGLQPVPGGRWTSPAVPPPPRFSDIAGSTHAGSILAVADEGITTGYSDGTFRPRLAVTRGQMATFLARALDLPPATSAGFSDTAGDVHESAIDAVAAAGITSGHGDGRYRPGDPVTRGQVASLLFRALDLPTAESAGFPDTAGTTHELAIDAIAAAGIARGSAGGDFRPQQAVTRDQMATFLARALHRTG